MVDPKPQPTSATTSADVDAPASASAAPPARWATLALVAVIVAVAVIEAGAALWPSARLEDELHAACAAVRAEFRPGDLITLGPSWLTQLGQRELGDLMPVTMLGRADARRYARIWTISFGRAGLDTLAADTAGLGASWQRDFGKVKLARYEQKPLTVTYDLTAQLLSAQVAQAALGGTTPAPEVPCLWSGAAPTPQPGRGTAAGAFRCVGSTVERRVMEVDYRPRYGVVTTVAQGQRTIIEYNNIADADWQGSRLALWLGLHDYHARKTAVGPAQVVVDLDHGAQRVTLPVTVAQGFAPHELTLPTATAGATHTIRLELSAAAATNHFVGLHGELRR